ncbi:helix-turn-helix domain-containing protein [Peribacillus butanolivorans]
MIHIKDVAEKWGLSRTTIYRYLENSKMKKSIIAP